MAKQAADHQKQAAEHHEQAAHQHKQTRRAMRRKQQRLTRLVSVRYLRDGIAGEGLIDDLSLSGSSMTGNAPVSVGMALALHIFVPGEPEPKVAERITTVISTLVRTQQGSFHKG